MEIYVQTTLENVIKRDVKGLYKKVLNHKIKDMIGVDSNTPYENPNNPDIRIDTEYLSIQQSFNLLTKKLKNMKVYS